VVGIIPRESLEGNFVDAQELLSQAVIPRQDRPLDVPVHRGGCSRLEPRGALPLRRMIAAFLPLALLHGGLLPQGLGRLLARLLVPHVVPQLRLVVVLKESSGWVEGAPLVYDVHRDQRLVQPLRGEVLLLPVLDDLAI